MRAARFGGIGAISGGGGNSRLLTDYPAAQQQQILDYLFEPGYGADLQILKVEIGGDTNSTDGSESSIEHASGSINCNNGYEWWLMEQAKALNPNIKLYGLAWGAPGWVGSFWSTATINYLVSWLNCAASHNLTINYLGGWNERGYNISWYEQLRSTLNADGYSSVQIVGADTDYSIATDIADNSTFANAVSIIGVHYPCAGGDGGSADSGAANSTAEGTGKPLWASENGSQDLNSGGARADPLDHPRLRGRRPDRIHQLAADRRHLPGPAVQHGWADPGQPAVVRRVQRGREPVGHRAGHPVHRAGLAVPQLRFRLPRRQRVQRQPRDAQIDRRHRLLHDHREHHGHGRADGHRQRVRRSVHRHRARVGDGREHPGPGRSSPSRPASPRRTAATHSPCSRATSTR